MTKPKTRLAWDPKQKPMTGANVYERERSHQLYHTSRWTKLAKAFKESHPLCQNCLKNGRVVPAEVVDHIIPFPICGDFFDESNLQSLCRRCNMVKGNQQREKIQRYKREHPDRLPGRGNPKTRR